MKVNMTLFPHGDSVDVVDGPHKGHHGVVVDWMRVDAGTPDVVHRVRLDKPLIVTERSPRNEVFEHAVDVVEVPASMLAESK